MAMPWLCSWEGLLPGCGPACPGPGMLHLQATMHFPRVGTGMRSGGWAQIYLCWMVCLGGVLEEGQVSSGNPQVWPASDLLLHFAGARCSSLFLGDTDHCPTGS